MNFDQVKLDRDRELRWRLLSLLHAARNGPLQGMSGPALLATANVGLPRDQRIEGSPHAIALLRDLVNAGYATETDERKFKHEIFELGKLFYRVTHRGSAQALCLADPDPMLDDGRIEE